MKIRLLLCCLIISTALSGCAVYPKRIAPVRTSLRFGDTKTAQELLEKVKGRKKDNLCYLFEKGTLDQVSGDYDLSVKSFAQAIDMFDKNDERAVIKLGAIGQQGAAVLVNDKMIEYDGEPFERVMLHSLQAINYLMKNNKQSARVEIKRAYQSAKRLEDIKQKKLAALQSDPNGGANISGALAAFSNAFSTKRKNSDLQLRAAKIINPYENAFAYYLSSLVYEANGDYGDACIDCESASRIAPGIMPIQSDVTRLQALTGRSSMGNSLQTEASPKPTQAGDTGDLVVVFQCGLAAEKKEIKIPVPVGIYQSLPNGQVIAPKAVTLAFPYYDDPTPCSSASTSIEKDGVVLGTTEIIADMDAFAERNLNDAYFGIISRAVLRAAIRTAAIYAASSQAANSANNNAASAAQLISVGMSIGGYFIEQADLRSWLLMPSNVQVARLSLPEGEHKLTFQLKGNAGEPIDKREVTVTIAKGKITFANLRGIDRIVNQIQLSKPL